jgi:hypothetical protein
VIKSRRLWCAGHVARTWERRGAYRAVVGKPEGRRPRGRPRHRWKDNIKMDLREVGQGQWRPDWLGIGAGCCWCGNEHSGFIKCGKFLH